MVDLSKLKEITEEIAREIKSKENGEIFKLLTLIFDNIDTLAIMVDEKSRILYVNKAEQDYLKQFNIRLSKGHFLYKDLLGVDQSPDWCPIKKALETRQIVIIEKDGEGPRVGHKFTITAIPLLYDGVAGAVVFTKID